ncbi:protein kinase [Myxococcota bacterium]|nr:protein kinase [Myxococcota bacterium]MBU1533744.1 protein kinase [Myxococcota bacterium]
MIGSKLDNRYLILEQLGEGGSGRVYLARHVNLGKRVAIKLLHGELLQDEKAVERFRKEALSVSELENSHIIKVFDLGQTANHLMYIAMEFLTGETLATRIAQRNRLDFHSVVSIIGEVCEGLMEAHAMGFIHRDLRPRNLMFTKHDSRDDFVKILDFGLAKIITGGKDPAKSGIGFTLGDPTYTAPEQMKGQPVSPRTDIYSLGIILYQALTGHPPFSGKNILEIMAAHLDSPYPRIEGTVPNLPRGVDQIIAKCMAKNPDDRYATVLQLKEALINLLDAPTVATQRDSQRVNPGSSYLNLQLPPGLLEGPSMVRMAGGGVVRLAPGETFQGLSVPIASIPVSSASQVEVATRSAAAGHHNQPDPRSAFTAPSQGTNTSDSPVETRKVDYEQTTARNLDASVDQPKSAQDQTGRSPHKKAGVLIGIEAPKIGQAPTSQMDAVDDPDTGPASSLMLSGPSDTFIMKQELLMEERAQKIRKERLFWSGIVFGGVLLAIVLWFIISKLTSGSDEMEFKSTAPMAAKNDMNPAMAPPAQNPPPMVADTTPPVQPMVTDPMVPPAMDVPPVMDVPPAMVVEPMTPTMHTTVRVMKPSMEPDIKVPMFTLPTDPMKSGTSGDLEKAKQLQNQGNIAGAYALYKKLAGRGSSFAALMGLASSAFELGKTAEAERALVKATRLRSSSLAWYKLGNARVKLGKTAGAKAAYKKALSLSPNFAAAKRALSRLEGK